MAFTLFIVNDAPYGNAPTYNALRLAGALGLCGTCMDSRGRCDDELIEGAKRGTLVDWTTGADKALVF